VKRATHDFFSKLKVNRGSTFGRVKVEYVLRLRTYRD
jgi:hypothetical protein